MQATLRAAAFAFLTILGGCSFAPTYKTPSSPPPAEAYAEAGDWRMADPVDNRARGAWWTLFQDSELDALEAKVGGANQNIKGAFARLQEARAATRIARADLFPTLNVAASATRERASQNSPTYVLGRNPTFNDFDIEADLASLDLEEHAELATDYYTLRSEDAEQVLLDNTVDDYARSLELTEHLYQGGAAAVADVDQARAQLEGARTQAADVALQRAQTEHAIAVLVGENPSRFHLAPKPLPQDSAPPHAQFDEQVADYRATVLIAYQEVEDNLAALRRLEQESLSEAAAVMATGKALEQARHRYKAGLVTYLEVATTETIALQAQQSRVNILNRRMDASVLLVKALGGGWRVDALAQTQTSAGATAMLDDHAK
jgi:outer membrane protein TolC